MFLLVVDRKITFCIQPQLSVVTVVSLRLLYLLDETRCDKMIRQYLYLERYIYKMKLIGEKFFLRYGYILHVQILSFFYVVNKSSQM